MDVSTSEQLDIVFRVLVAGALGAFVGLEREVRGYPAGIRTLALVAMGSALFTDMSQLFPGDDSSSRIASQIVVGVGFIGAGVIIQERGNIHGMTTAATIWAAAAIGMASGLSLYVVAVCSAVAMFVLLEARPITRRLDNFFRQAGIPIEVEDDDGDPDKESGSEAFYGDEEQKTKPQDRTKHRRKG
jgi:putative Mg2+ transporter-C (MgtC) family protein